MIKSNPAVTPWCNNLCWTEKRPVQIKSSLTRIQYLKEVPGFRSAGHIWRWKEGTRMAWYKLTHLPQHHVKTGLFSIPLSASKVLLLIHFWLSAITTWKAGDVTNKGLTLADPLVTQTLQECLVKLQSSFPHSVGQSIRLCLLSYLSISYTADKKELYPVCG